MWSRKLSQKDKDKLRENATENGKKVKQKQRVIVSQLNHRN